METSILKCIDWKQYLDNYPDLVLAGINNQTGAIRHYRFHGKSEGRLIKFNLHCLTGVFKNFDTCYRFGNLLFFTYIISFIAKINKIPINYINLEQITQLGIPLYTEGSIVYDKTIYISNSNINEVLHKNTTLNKNIIISDYLQTPETAKFIRNLIIENKENIIKKNPFNYDNNNLFVHVRLGDITNTYSHPFEYYDKAIGDINFGKGFISSDSIKNEICQKLINKYKLIVYNSSEVETIQFGSSCKNIVLSTGTFSWYIGAFSFESKVYFPEIKKVWHGDIFIFEDWKKISY